MKYKFKIFLIFSISLSISSIAQDTSTELLAKIEAMAKVGACYSPSFSPDGKEIAFISTMSGIPQLWKISATGGWPVQLTNFNDPVSEALWSPTGNQIAIQLAPGGGMNSQIYLINSNGTGLKQLTDGGKSNNWLIVWSGDGSLLSYSSNKNNPTGMDSYLYHLQKDQSELLFNNQGIGVVNSFSRDNSQFLQYRSVTRGSNDYYLMDKV